MNALQQKMHTPLTHDLSGDIKKACERLAPTWPLDQMIAVNPWWELRDRPFSQVSAELAAMAQVRCLMPKTYYRKLWKSQIQPQHLQQAAVKLDVAANIDELVEHLQTPDWQGHWHNVSDWLDSYGNRNNKMAWQDEITHQISQFCAEFFQSGTPFNDDADDRLYSDWLALTKQDRGLEILMAEPQLRKQFEALPEHHELLLEEAFKELAFDRPLFANYLHALLLDINGWASWAAYLRWQTRLDGITEHCLMEQLLSVRLAWELALWRHYKHRHANEFRALNSDWQKQWAMLPQLINIHRQTQRLTWVWQRAAELSYQRQLHNHLVQIEPAERPDSAVLQAVFCIDVRSEPIRRALEAQHPVIETLGFAGFFGLPLQYQPSGTSLRRPQLPGLLKPAIEVSEAVSPNSHLIKNRKNTLRGTARFQALQDSSPATLALVEASGLAYSYQLLKSTFFPEAPSHPVNGLAQPDSWSLTQNGAALTLEEKTELAAGILKAMGLTKNFAPTVLLVGHGSQTCNNPHAAGLDCGACGGQTGEINVRVLASLLNEPVLRDALAAHEITIPDQCRFIPALHNTTTDDIDCLDELANDDVQAWLAKASQQTRCERSDKLGIADKSEPEKLAKLIRKRSRDWSQVRPEWGLANNASFIVAPRSFSESLDLAGRSFLHDYRWQDDEGFNTLELIMTAPMIVTNWINMQYNASVTDNQKYGSGNKVLHNVVGGNLGVFEGNGGDLRIGLSLQSLHDGKNWMHQPLRLSVYIAAPKQAMADIINRHEHVADLINNDWLYVYQWDIGTRTVNQYYHENWYKPDS